MLIPVYGYETELQSAYQKIIYNPRYMFWNYNTYWNKELTIPENTYNSINFVSIIDNKSCKKVIGYLGCEVDRCANIIISLGVINFEDISFTFSNDFYEFIDKMFIEFKFDKIHFSVVVGNPAEKIYDKFIKKYKGEICGYFKKHVKLQDGNMYDVKYYDLFRNDYIINK